MPPNQTSQIRTTPTPVVLSTRPKPIEVSDGFTVKTFPRQPNTKYVASTRRTPMKTTRKPRVYSTKPRPIQIDHGFKCKDLERSNNGQAMERDFDYFALSMNWPETACRFLMTKGKTCNIQGIVLMKNWQECCCWHFLNRGDRSWRLISDVGDRECRRRKRLRYPKISNHSLTETSTTTLLPWDCLNWRIKTCKKQMLISGLFMGFGQITKTSDMTATFQSIVAVEMQISTHLMENLS